MAIHTILSGKIGRRERAINITRTLSYICNIRLITMSKADSFRLRARECIGTAFPVAMAALSLLFLLVSTDISQACAGAAKTAAHAKTHATVQAPSESTVQKLAVDVAHVASTTAASASKVRASHCCNTSGNHCAGDACAKGCCAACAPAVLVPSYNLVLIDVACAHADRQGSAVFYIIPSPAFRPPRTIA
jgi:hypothetical protein